MAPPNQPPKPSRSQQAAQNTANQARQSAAQTGPEFAKRLGQNLDLTKGVNLGAAAPMYGGQAPELPGVGSTIEAPEKIGLGGFIPPGVIPSPEQLQQLAALPDDHDHVVGSIGRGPPSNTPKARQPVHKAQPKEEHPILKQLKIDLGIDFIEPIDVRIGGHVWTMKVLTEQDVSIAARMADMLAQTQSDHTLKMNTAIVCTAIIAIDGEPVWDVFGIEVAPDELPLSNPLLPPEETRRLGILKLYDFVSKQSKTQLGQKLYEAYSTKVDQYGEVKSQLEDPNNPRVKFVCTTKDCAFNLVDFPQYEPGTRNILPYFCKVHGTIMEPMGKLNNDGGIDPLE